MKKLSKVAAAGLLSALVATSMAGTAFAQDAWWTSGEGAAPTTADQAVTPATNLLTTYGVRAGSAGGDFMGLSNTNYDFSLTNKNNDSTGAMYDYTKVTEYSATSKSNPAYADNYTSAGLAIWASAANENANPYYRNLFINLALRAAPGSTEAVANAATTWTTNSNSWGDLNATYADAQSSSYTPDIVFGAVKNSGWGNFDPTETNWYKTGKVTDSTKYANNDATNVWTQIYSMGQLAVQADATTGKVTRYNNSKATQSAIDYEKAIKGNLLYVASKIDSGAQAKKTVAYLYAVDETAGTMYFFTPKANKLTYGNDTNGASESTVDDADENYASNNSTINMGYMGVLPYVSNTFDSGTSVKGGIVMMVEDIYKSNPACTVSTSDMSALKDVDVIIYNTNTALTATGTSNGLNSNGIVNTGTYAKGITEENLKTLLGDNFTGTLIGGDDWGTSSKQPAASASATATENGMSPLLYCTRNYTADKDTRAAWCFSQVYPELYGNNPDATYGYWVNKVYHIQTAYVPSVVKYMTLKSGDVVYTDATATDLEAKFQEGYNWWVNTGSKSSTWSKYAYYNGSSRASWYSGNDAAEEPANLIGIMAPSSLWTAQVTPTPTPTPAVVAKAQTISGKTTVTKTYKAAKKTKKLAKAKTAQLKTAFKLSAKTALSYKKTSGNSKITVTKAGKVTVKKGLKKGTYKVKVKVTAKATTAYKQATKTITLKVKVK